MKTDKGFWESAAERAHSLLAEMRAERDELSLKVEQLNSEILQWEKVLASLKPLTSDPASLSNVRVVPNISDASLSDACLEIVNSVQSNLTARAIRNILEASGYEPNGKHNNPLASIHGVLKRLAESGKVESQEANGQTFYRARVTSGHNVRRLTAEESALLAEKRDLEQLVKRTGKLSDLKSPIKKSGIGSLKKED